MGAARTARLSARILGDEAGMPIVRMPVLMPAIIGRAALSTDDARWGYNHLILQAAADATSARVAKLSDGGFRNV